MSNPEVQTKTEDLIQELADLKLRESQPYLSEARKAPVRIRIGRIAFELIEREKEQE